VETLVSKRLPAGRFEATWDAGRYSSGIYVYRLQAEGFVETKKIILMK
jgi:hypothetical protein